MSFSYDFPENKQVMQSGDIVKVQVRGTAVTFSDYYWTEADYAQIFTTVRVWIAERLTPLGTDEDPVEWLDEKHKPATLIYVLKKGAVQ